MQKWTFFQTGNTDAEKLIKTMGGFGKEGWDLVSVVFDPESSRFIAFFKRPITE